MASRSWTGRPGCRGAAAMVVGAVLLTCGCGGDAGGGRPAPERAYVLREQPGVFRGVQLGDPEARVAQRFGEDQGPPDGSIGPLGADREDSGSPGTFASSPTSARPDDRTAYLRYPGMAFVTNDRRVYVIMSSLAGTRTARGVRVGDTLERARGSYRQLVCETATDAHGGALFRYCRGKLADRRFIYFGGDPIGTIAVAEVPLYG